MRKAFLIFIALTAVICFSGCDATPTKVDAAYAKEFASKATYIQDAKTGLCFAIVRVIERGLLDQISTNWIWVPCAEVKQFIE